MQPDSQLECQRNVLCTYRAIRRKALERIWNEFRVTTNFFGPEMMVLGYQRGLRSVQIPVNYRSRVGESSVTGDLVKAFGLGVQMILLIASMRIGREWMRTSRRGSGIEPDASPPKPPPG